MSRGRYAALLLALLSAAHVACAAEPVGEAAPAAPVAQSQAELTPEALQAALECRSSADTLFALATALFGGTPPDWVKPVPDNGHPGMLGLWTYRLARPIRAFGQDVDTLSLLNQWIVIERPRAAALAIVADRHMERAPIRATEQYFRFADARAGPMLGAFAPTDDALMLAFGVPPKPDAENATLFVGCNYAAISQADFLDAARQADAMLEKAGSALRRDIEGGK